MISTRALSNLPDIDALRRIMKSLAMLDAIISPEWPSRYFSFNCRWAPGEQMGSMRDGEGDHYFSLFNSSGCWLKGFAHESGTPVDTTASQQFAARVFEGVPKEFAGCLSEPAFIIPETTFSIWRLYADHDWQHGATALQQERWDLDSSSQLLRWLDGKPRTYHQWAEEYYHRELSLAAVEAIYDHKLLSQHLITELNPDLSLSEIDADLNEIGYPEWN